MCIENLLFLPLTIGMSIFGFLMGLNLIIEEKHEDLIVLATAMGVLLLAVGLAFLIVSWLIIYHIFV